MSDMAWKDHLLSSGLPLEHSVKRILKELGILTTSEYKYERINELGIPVQFSIDTHATHINTKSNLWLDLFIECKYRKEGIRWIFTPERFETVLGPEFRDVFIVLDSVTQHKINSEVLNRFGNHYELCGKGVELLHKETNPKTIKQSIQQLKFALVGEVITGMTHQIDKLLGDDSPIFIIVPIVVTTAGIWRLNDTITLEDIKNAENLEKIAEQKDIVIVYESPDNELILHTKRKLAEGFRLDQKMKIDKYLKNSGRHGFDFFSDWFSRNYPSLYVIVHYNRFKAAMINLLNFLNRDDITKER